PTFSPIREAVCKSWQQPENVQADIVTAVKKTLADFLGASPDKYDILFAGNTTEALNIAADLIQNEYGNNSEPVIVNTLLEHNSNELPWRYIPGASLITMPVDSEGFVDLHELEEILRDYNERGVFGKKRVRLVAVSGSSNVLGTINDIAAISKIVHTYHARLLVDAAQLAAHRTINMETCDIDYLAFTGNKVYAPFGCGALLVKKEHIHISNSELKRIKDSGEENIIGITALGKAVILLQRIGMDVIENRERALTARLLQGLSGIKGIEVFGIKDPRSKQFHQKGGVVAFRFKRIPHNLVAKELAELGGIGVRNGCFCAHLLVKHLLKINRARVLLAQAGLLLIPGFTNRVLPGLVRVSFGLQNDEREIERLLAVLKRIESAPRSAINKLLASTGNGTPFLSRTKTGEEMDGFLETCIEKVYSV
ncbi:MAG: aminotransferase class V-fold PLP-dependent enzyme, partial [bacterium]|nr:aminotransferase class V-fold PLP-dependent enzyme [bacterium]